MTVFSVTRRDILGNKPWEVRDYDQGLYTTKDLAEDCVKRHLGNEAVCDDGWFDGVWTSPRHPKIEYIVSEQVVHCE